MAEDSTAPRQQDPLRTTDPVLASLIEEKLSLPVHTGDDMVELMTRAAALAVQHIMGADHAGITAAFDEVAPFTVAPTDDEVRRFDRTQYELGGGPCLLASKTDQIVDIDVTEMGKRWPDLAITAHETRIRCVVAAPLHRRRISIGSLNLYTDAGTAETPSSTSPVLMVLLEHLDRGLDDFGDHLTTTTLASQLQQSVETRMLVDSAVGMVMGLTHCSYDDAVDRLESKARTENVSRRVAATRILNDRSL